MSHGYGPYFASFMYRGFIGSSRTCEECGFTERVILGGYGDRRDRIADRLSWRLREKLSTSDWYRWAHHTDLFLAEAERQRKQGAELLRQYPGQPFRGPNFAGAARYLAPFLGASADEIEAKARSIWARGDLL